MDAIAGELSHSLDGYKPRDRVGTLAFQAEVGTREKAVEQSHETHEWGKEGVTRGRGALPGLHIPSVQA